MNIFACPEELSRMGCEAIRKHKQGLMSMSECVQKMEDLYAQLGEDECRKGVSKSPDKIEASNNSDAPFKRHKEM